MPPSLTLNDVEAQYERALQQQEDRKIIIEDYKMRVSELEQRLEELEAERARHQEITESDEHCAACAEKRNLMVVLHQKSEAMAARVAELELLLLSQPEPEAADTGRSADRLTQGSAASPSRENELCKDLRKLASVTKGLERELVTAKKKTGQQKDEIATLRGRLSHNSMILAGSASPAGSPRRSFQQRY